MPSPADLIGGATGVNADPAAEVARLADSVEPFLIGVRHHSPALSVVVPDLLDGFAPDVLLIELPAELQEWLVWLADPATVAPVAMAGVVGGADAAMTDAAAMAFYPFADFSPELVAVRWAARHDVPVVACDLPLADRAWRGRGTADGADNVGLDDVGPGPGPMLTQALQAASSGRDGEDMWDRMVEAAAPGSDPESVRRAALLVGWAMRHDATNTRGVDRLDLRREAWMRRCLAQADGRRVAAVVGSFHAAALPAGGDAAPDALADEADIAHSARRSSAKTTRQQAVATSLVPYTFALLDERSGYPAGIRDPQWQQAVVGAAGQPAALESAAVDTIVRVTAAIRAAGHPCGPAEARETVRLATDLARLRGLPAPGRGELVEAMQSVLAHGEMLGRGRVVAAAMQRALIGDRRGTLAPGTPRSGLGPAVREQAADLRLPGPGGKPGDLRLDPLRSDLDRRRDIALRQFTVCAIPYATPVTVDGVGGTDSIGAHWRAEWTPQTDAMLDVLGVRGVTLPQAAEGVLREHLRRETADGGATPAQVINGLRAAASCAIISLVAHRLTELAAVVPASATLPEALAALDLLDQIRLEHIPGLLGTDLTQLPDVTVIAQTVHETAVRHVDGLTGSEDVADAHALAVLANRVADTGIGLRLTDALTRLAAAGTPLMAAAAAATLVVLGVRDASELGARVGSWLDMAATPQARTDLRGRLTGLLAVAEPLVQAASSVLDPLVERIETLSDTDFVTRLPALRGGFHVLSPAARERLLAVIDERLHGEETAGGSARDIGVLDDPDTFMARLLADRAGRHAVAARGLDSTSVAPEPVTSEPVTSASAASTPETAPTDSESTAATPTASAPTASALPANGAETITAPDRWRLILGRTAGCTGRTRHFANALDELYGAGRGEGERADAAARAGREAPFPGVREWSEELAALFGDNVRQEVLARAAEAGRVDAVLELDPERARASVELLQTVLSLAGGLSEAAVTRLRPLVARVIAELTKELATRLRPALAGLNTPRPTYRPGGQLDLNRTVRRNLATSSRKPDGNIMIIPDRPVFHTRARRGVDWRVVLVVDVSGSMEASVIWSALTASVLAGVPALTTHFVAFSTEVVDLTDRVADPLGLLLEVKVGGGTHIAAGLRYARQLVTVPSRTMVVVVSDFEEGYPLAGLLGQVRALVESGCTVLGCASLDDAGRPRYSVPVAGQLVAAGMPVAALSPLELARWVGEQVR